MRSVPVLQGYDYTIPPFGSISLEDEILDRLAKAFIEGVEYTFSPVILRSDNEVRIIAFNLHAVPVVPIEFQPYKFNPENVRTVMEEYGPLIAPCGTHTGNEDGCLACIRIKSSTRSASNVQHHNNPYRSGSGDTEGRPG